MTNFDSALMRALSQWSIVFVQYGKILRELDLMSTVARLELEVVDSKVVVGDLPAPEYEDKNVLVDRVDKLIYNQSGSLGKLRSYVGSLTSRNCRVALSSRRPRASYPSLIGSEVIADSKPLRFSFSDEQLEKIHELIQGEAEFLVEVLRELDFSTVESLSACLWDGAGESGLSVLPSMSAESLLGAGLLKAEDGDLRLNSSVPVGLLRDRASSVYANSLEGSDNGKSCYQEIWVIERSLRNKMREWLMNSGSVGGQSWRDLIAPDKLKSDIIERAQVGGFPHVSKIKELQDPLEWLTLGELLDLREKKSMGDLGMSSRHWKLLRDDLIPVRNRIMHMRQVTYADLEMTRRWRRKINTI